MERTFFNDSVLSLRGAERRGNLIEINVEIASFAIMRKIFAMTLFRKKITEVKQISILNIYIIYVYLKS